MNTKINRYEINQIEPKWRSVWEKDNAYQTGDDPDKKNIYILDFFPYPSGEGLSVGHLRNYVPTDVYSRYFRMNGYNVLHPMGWDAFGLPAENYAIKHNIHPQESTRLFCDTYKRQMKLAECSYDWSREINSTDPDYYKWTQYFFLMLYERGLAYRAKGSQWWCPECQTILANEQVENGRCWRCDSMVTKKELEQWYFKITEYADRLIADLDKVDWPDSIKLMQRNWIGRSEGAEVKFQIGDFSEKSHASNEISVFTTRPDTLFGVTFMVLAPEHPLVSSITTAEQQTAVSNYIEQAKIKTEIDRASTEQEKTGVFTGGYAIHPLTQEPIPIWISDYVMMGYGTGAVMGVPAHDQRDFGFARKFGLPIIEVISPDGSSYGIEACTSEKGILLNSGVYSGMTSEEAIQTITADLQANGQGEPKVTYKLRDWLISRQRYWGAPIPMVTCDNCGSVPVPQEQLPVRLPDTNNFSPMGNGRSPLAGIDSWVNTTCPKCDGPATRETDTMDGFACSSWYFLRFASPHETERPFDPEAVKKWLPVDTYVGGAEHAVLHLLYARFWTKVMFDAGMIDFDEPFTQLRNQGMLLSAKDGQKMSKSKGNVVTPDEVASEVGTDALRLYVLFVGPFDHDVLWDSTGIKGASRFLDRLWRLVTDSMTPKSGALLPPPVDVPDRAFEQMRHKVVQKVTADFENFRFNTAVAAMMEYLNYLSDAQSKDIYPPQWHHAIETFLKLLSPICPFITEELWQTVMHQKDSIHTQSWPTFNEAMTIDDEQLIIIQVNGKVRDRITVSAGIDEAVLKETAVNQPNVQKYIDGKSVKKVIVVPSKLINIVI